MPARGGERTGGVAVRQAAQATFRGMRMIGEERAQGRGEAPYHNEMTDAHSPGIRAPTGLFLLSLAGVMAALPRVTPTASTMLQQ